MITSSAVDVAWLPPPYTGGAADLALDFSSSTLDPRLSYTSRGSNAMQYDSQGRLVWAPANMLTYSDQFDNAAWSKAAVTVSANATIAPDGTTAADTLTETAAISSHYLTSPPAAIPFSASASYTYSVYAKNNGRRYLQLYWGGGASMVFHGNFDLQNGVVGTTGLEQPGAGASISSSIVNVGNGWYRCVLTMTMRSDQSGSTSVLVVLSNSASASSTPSYAGDGTSGIYIWGAQLELRGIDSPKPYNATTSAAYYAPRLDYDPGTLQPKGLFLEEAGTNLLTWSTNLDTATGGWTNTDTTVSTSSVIGPDGFPCQLLTEGVAGTSWHSKIAAIPAATDFVCGSVFLKRGNTDWVRVAITDGTNGFQSWFNIALGIAGTLSLVGAGGTATAAYIESVGAGWYRCAVIGKVATGTSAFLNTHNTSADNTTTRVNNATRYEFGPQLESVSGAATRWASSYIPTYGATATRNADQTPNMSVAGVWNSAGGTMVVEATTPNIPSGVFPAIAAFSDGGATNRIYHYHASGGQNPGLGCVITTASVAQWNTQAGNVPNWNAKYSLAFANSDFAQYSSLGGSATQLSASTLPTITTLAFASSGGIGAVGYSRWIKSFKYYARRRPNAELQALADLTSTPQVDLGFLSYGQNQGLLDRRLTWTDRASNATMFDSLGRLVWAPANMVVGSDAPAGQSITVASGQSYTVSLYGTASDSITLSNAYAGTLTGTGLSNRVSLTFTAASGTLTLAKTNSPVYVQVEPTGVDSPKPYLRTETAAVYRPRIDYDPATGTCLGLLLEEQRTNLLTYSQDFSNAAWSKGAVTVTANVAVAPGGATAADLVYPTSSGLRYIYAAASVISGAPYTVSIYLKAAGLTWVHLSSINGSVAKAAWFNLSTGVIGTIAGGVTAAIYPIGNGWFRCSVTDTTTSTTGNLQLVAADADNSTNVTASGTSGYYLWGAQLEAGAFPTSYIPTYGSAATRNADYAPYMPLPYSPNAHLGTYTYAGGVGYSGSLTRLLAASSDSTHYLNLYSSTTPTIQAEANNGAGSTTGQPTAAGPAARASFRAVGMFAGTPATKLSFNGGAVATGASASYANSGLTELVVGSVYQGVAVGNQQWISRIRRYHNFAFSDAQLQALSSGYPTSGGGSTVAFGASATTIAIPPDGSGNPARYARLIATAPCYVKLSGPGVTAAVVGDLMVQPADAITVNTCGLSYISALQVSGAGTLQVSPLENA